MSKYMVMVRDALYSCFRDVSFYVKCYTNCSHGRI